MLSARLMLIQGRQGGIESMTVSAVLVVRKVVGDLMFYVQMYLFCTMNLGWSFVNKISFFLS